ncbi:hypothetical protein F5984_20520 [Rudanella paleaurantiibacter]|uniref:Uncharacterized protein n=1 Tax=Rudanella paleaurantiibacter TaxID=2614655 RepID=A0A7J5TW25_9BACT|nr:DUF6712 family protein [Rudanella paleaurantiibacter]KAB7728133.1 hypothetical protein F5984_20520 [Rudanella paleaurantiibacter]
MELINNTAELRQVCTVSSDLLYDRYKPHLQSAEQILITYVGRAVVNRIKEANQPSALEIELRQLFRRVVGNMALFKLGQVGNVDISNVGLQRTKTDNTNDAFEWQVDRLTRQLEADGLEALEATIAFLDEHAEVFSEYIPVSPERLIRTATLFSSHVFIRNSRLVFRSLEASIATVEARYRRMPVIRAFLEDYPDAPSAEQREYMTNLQRAVANAAMAHALRTQVVELTGDGVQVRSISQVLTLNYRSSPNKDLLFSALSDYDSEAAFWLNSVLTELRPTDAGPVRTGGPQGKAIVSF